MSHYTPVNERPREVSALDNAWIMQSGSRRRLRIAQNVHGMVRRDLDICHFAETLSAMPHQIRSPAAGGGDSAQQVARPTSAFPRAEPQ